MEGKRDEITKPFFHGLILPIFPEVKIPFVKIKSLHPPMEKWEIFHSRSVP